MKVGLAVLAGAVALAVPFLLNEERYLMHIAIMTCIFIPLALSFNLLWGYTGLLSLGHTAFFGIGAYTTALLAAHHARVPSWIDFPLAGLLAGAIALLVGIPALRMAKTSFVMVTLAFLIVTQVVDSNWVSLTNGAMGVSNVPSFWIGLPGGAVLRFGTRLSNYYLTLTYAAVVTVFIAQLVRSRVGRVFRAIRDNELLAQSNGVATFKYKLIAFVTAGTIAGMSGSLYAHYITFVGPAVFDFPFLTRMLIIVIVGGTGTIGGVIAGAILFTAVPEVLRLAAEYRETVFGAVVLLTILYLPDGLAGLWNRVQRRIRRQRGANA
jgi:branched-chain amino acid transport system permease protein